MATTTTVDQYIEAIAEPLRAVAQELKPVIDTGLPEAMGLMWHGHPVWMIGKTPVALLKAYPQYVTFALFRGQLVTDRSGWLVPNSREMASVKLRKVNEIDEAFFAGWLQQAQTLELSQTA